MEKSGKSYSSPTEKELFGSLAYAVSGSSDEYKHNRIEGLEELLKRIKSGSIHDINWATRILLNMAKVQGNNRPESLLTVDALTLILTKYEEAFQTVLDGLVGQDEKIFLCFSKVVLSLDYDKKRQAIKPLVDFLMTRDALTKLGVNETYTCLISLGNEGLGQEIVEAASPHLDSSILEFGAIFYSIKLCAEFADHKLLPKMLAVLDKSMKGYFDGNHVEVERAICEFLKRVRDGQSFTPLIDLLKTRSTEQSPHIYEAIASVLNANPSFIDDILEKLYDERHNKSVVDNLLQSIAKTDKPRIDVPKLLSYVHIHWWWEFPTKYFVQEILIKQGNQSKSSLLSILKQGASAEVSKFSFALECLKAIGVSNEEISAIFPKPPMLQVYNFCRGKGKPPKNLIQMWEEKGKLGDEVFLGRTTRLDHLLFHVFVSFNFVTLNVDPAGVKGVDIVCFYPKTLDLFIIGCTTGTLKDDLTKIDATVKNMKAEMKELFNKCSVTSIVACSEIASIPTSDVQYALQNRIIIMQPNQIDTLLEMLNTNRQPREVIDFIKRISPN